LGESKNKKDVPTFIVAKTLKGKGTAVSDKLGYHGKPLTGELYEKTITDLNLLITNEPNVIRKFKYTTSRKINESAIELTDLDKLVAKKSTRVGCGEGLLNLMNNDKNEEFRIVALDGDVGNSTMIGLAGAKHPDRFVQCFIAEQNMVLVAQGLSCLGLVPVMASFSAFLSRAFDQFRMNNINQCNIKVYGTHSGVHIGEDGGSQMGLEDISMFCSLFDCVVL